MHISTSELYVCEACHQSPAFCVSRIQSIGGAIRIALLLSRKRQAGSMPRSSRPSKKRDPPVHKMDGDGIELNEADSVKTTAAPAAGTLRCAIIRVFRQQLVISLPCEVPMPVVVINSA